MPRPGKPQASGIISFPPTDDGGALDSKTKVLIAQAIGVTTRCDGCIGFHTEALVRLGATRQEVEEVLGMAVYMVGGPCMRPTRYPHSSNSKPTVAA
jgi:AhpD family alkylhydroperoxidase